MIQPEEIRRKAENLYPQFLRAWLDGETFFPREVRGRKRPKGGLAAAGESFRRLRDGSKEVRGYGYTVEWVERNSRTHGRNPFPQRILFETQNDFLRTIGRQREFAAFAAAVDRIRTRRPELQSWLRSNIKRLTKLADKVDGLLDVVDYFRTHPRPMVFAREIPLSVDTKFIEEHRGILREWLDLVLPSDAIRADEDRFERRYGLRYDEPHLLVRFLDPDVQRDNGVPWAECSVPLHQLAATPLTADSVLIVENKVNLLTLPSISGGLALGGLGDSVTDLWKLKWLSQRPIWYWGDLDVDGFAILSRLRQRFPQIQSLMMDADTARRWQAQLGELVSERPMAPPAGLTESELAAFGICARENLRIEQERLPHRFVLESLQTTFRSVSMRLPFWEKW